MATLTFPTLSVGPTTMIWGQRSFTRTFTSPYGSVQTLEIPGARWAVQVSYPTLTQVDRALLEAFLVQLRGQAGRFLLYDFTRPAPVGTLRGSPTLSAAAAQGAVTAAITGTGTLLRGDKVAINGELKMVVADMTAPGTVTFEPPLRAAASSGAAVGWDRPTAQFLLASDDWRTALTLPLSAVPAAIDIDGLESWT